MTITRRGNLEADLSAAQRRLRRALIGASALEGNLHADLEVIQKRASQGKASRLEREFLISSVGALREAFSEAVDALHDFKQMLAKDVVDNVSEVKNAIDREFPDMAAETKSSLLATLDTFGGIRGWVQNLNVWLTSQVDLHQRSADTLAARQNQNFGDTLSALKTQRATTRSLQSKIVITSGDDDGSTAINICFFAGGIGIATCLLILAIAILAKPENG